MRPVKVNNVRSRKLNSLTNEQKARTSKTTSKKPKNEKLEIRSSPSLFFYSGCNPRLTRKWDFNYQLRWIGHPA